MREDVKAMLPELPMLCDLNRSCLYYNADDIHDWLDKLTEGAYEVHGSDQAGWTKAKIITDKYRALLIPLGEIKKQTPLEIAVEALQQIVSSSDIGCLTAEKALAQIEAAK